MSLKVTRLYRTLPITPHSTSQPGWSVHMRCSCGSDREFMSFDRVRRRWSDDWADIFAQTKFRCACGWEAVQMRVIRRGTDHTETMLKVTKPVPQGQPSHERAGSVAKSLVAEPPRLRLTPPRGR